MITCINCNSQNNDSDTLCNVCGTPLQVSPLQFNMPVENLQPTNINMPNMAIETPNISTNYIPNGSNRFVNNDEFTIATLRHGIIANPLSNVNLQNEDVCLSNKRLYCTHAKGIFNISMSNENVDINDITGTKIASYRPLGTLILSILLFIASICMALAENDIGLIGIAISIVLFITYLCLSNKHLKIEYAGGCIRVNVKKYKMQNIKEFQRCIYSAKDAIDNSK